jgi:hypothetical protein
MHIYSANRKSEMGILCLSVVFFFSRVRRGASGERSSVSCGGGSRPGPRVRFDGRQQRRLRCRRPGMRRMRQEDHREVPPQGAGPLLARGLPQVRLLRLPPRGGRFHALHQGQPHTLQEGLPQVRLLRITRQLTRQRG